MIGIRVFSLAALCLIGFSSVMAAEPREKNGALRPLLDCRKVADAAQRLACFDRESASLDAADEKNEITVLDKEDVRETRRSLFGFSLPRLPFITGDDDKKGDAEKAEEAEITAVIASARALGFDKWEFQLEDGARWVTLDPINVKAPTPGKPVVIRKATLGSYFARFDGGRGVRAKRVD